jgi:hypothetical protein
MIENLLREALKVYDEDPRVSVIEKLELEAVMKIRQQRQVRLEKWKRERQRE